MSDVVKMKAEPLRCPGLGRVADNPKALIAIFNRPVSDDEMRYLHDVLRRAAACNPVTDAEPPLRCRMPGCDKANGDSCVYAGCPMGNDF